MSRRRHFRVLALATATVLSGFGLMTTAAAASTQGQAGTTLTVGVSGALNQNKVYSWTLAKDANPATQDIWLGDQATVHYKVTATRDAGTLSDIRFQGEVDVTNGGAVATQGLDVQAQLEQKGAGSTWNIVYPASANLASGELAAGQTGQYPFDFVYTGPTAGTFRVDGMATITNHSSYIGQPNTTTTRAPVVYALHEVNGQLAVTDSVGGDHTFAGTDTWAYDHAYQPGDLGDHTYPNTVSGGGLSADATIHVHVYGLDVQKQVSDTAFARTYHWSLGDPAMDNLKVTEAGGQYVIPVKVTHEDSGWSVEGTVTITNNTPLDANIQGIVDSIPTIHVDDPPAVLPAGQSVTLGWSGGLPNGDPETNHVDVMLSNGTAFGADAQFDFNHAPNAEYGKTAVINVSGDTITGDGQAPVQGPDGTFQVTEP